MRASFHNKILRVNLTNRTIRVEEPGQVYLRRYMGGWNFIGGTLRAAVPWQREALTPKNCKKPYKPTMA